MTAIHADLSEAKLALHSARKGPVTAARQRRTAMIYGLACVIGAAPLVLSSPAWLQAAGVGLWLPGGGFLADGGWAALLFPLTLALFVASLVAWFWAGAVTAPLLVWLGSAVLAGTLADETIWRPGPAVAVVAIAAAAAAVAAAGGLGGAAAGAASAGGSAGAVGSAGGSPGGGEGAGAAEAVEIEADRIDDELPEWEDGGLGGDLPGGSPPEGA